jgi:hypothetical protein
MRALTTTSRTSGGRRPFVRAEVDTLKSLLAETDAQLDAMLPAILDRAFKGEL